MSGSGAGFGRKNNTSRTKAATESECPLRVQLIDFGRALCVTPPPPLFPNNSSSSSSYSSSNFQQLQQLHNHPSQSEILRLLYLKNSASNAAGGGGGGDKKKEEGVCAGGCDVNVEYEGDVSCKGYQCIEMQRGQGWSYQVKLINLLLFVIK